MSHSCASQEVLKDYHLENSTIQLAVGSETESPECICSYTGSNEEVRKDVLTGMNNKLGAFDILRIEKSRSCYWLRIN